MTPPPNSTAANHKKVYRFALYGRRNSGKTCILAALAMERVAHPDGLSCTWLDTPDRGSRPTGGPGNRIEDEITAAFTHGKDWLEQAIRNLEQGTVPPPNPHDKDAIRFMYEFTAADHRTFLVELIDYSGELIDPDLSDTDLAKRLRQHMLTMDGILVLAEAPHRGQQAGELYKELQRLKRAFAALRGEKQDGPSLAVPVALLINKWDRRTQTDGFSSANCPQELEDFLASQPEPPHRGLVDTLRGSVAEGLFRAFPVSAFGKYATNGKVNGSGNGQRHPERPAQVNPLCSFGLEDGFVWACRCRDQIDVGEFEAEANRRVWWKPWQLADWKVRRSLTARASQLGNRFPEDSEEKRRVRRAAGRSATAIAGQLGLAGMILAIMYFGAGGVNDYLNYRAHRPTFANLQAAEKEQLNQAETWLEHYGNNKWLFHAGFRPFFSGESAAAQLVAIREWKRGSALAEWNERWKEIERAPDEVTKEGLAKKLRDDLRGATYSDENVVAKCNSLLEQCEANRRIRDNVSALQTVEAEFTNLVSSKSEVKEEYRRVRRHVEDLPVHKDGETKELAERRIDLTKKIDDRLDEIERLDVDRKNTENNAFISEQERRLKAGGEVADFELILAAVKRGLPYGDVASDQIQQRYSTLRLEAQGKLDDAIRRRDWLKFEDEYHALMRRGNLREAAQRLVEKGMDFTEIAGLKADFCKKCLPQLEDKKGELVKGKQWDRARETLKTVRTDKYAKTLLADEQLRKIEDMEHEVNINEDKHLYAQVENRKTRTTEAIQKYLADAPLKTMKKKVEDYRDYLQKMEGALELEVEIASIEWGASCWERKNDFLLTIGGHSVVDVHVNSKPNTISKDVGSGKILCKLTEKITCNITVNAHTRTYFLGIWATRDENGKGSFDGSVEELRNGKTVELDKYGTKVVIKLKQGCLPKEPTLPEWRE